MSADGSRNPPPSGGGAVKLTDEQVIELDRIVVDLMVENDMLRKDAERLMFACQFDGYSTVSKDRYDFAMDCAEEAGRDEPSEEDELEGLRRLIDAAMAAQPGGEQC